MCPNKTGSVSRRLFDEEITSEKCRHVAEQSTQITRYKNIHMNVPSTDLFYHALGIDIDCMLDTTPSGPVNP